MIQVSVLISSKVHLGISYVARLPTYLLVYKRLIRGYGVFA